MDRPRRRACAVATLMALAAVPSRAIAQRAFEFTPVFDAIEAYDTNLLFSPLDRTGDFQTRVSPGAEAQFESPVVTLHTRYALDADRFANHPELSAVNGQRATVEFHYSATRRVAIAADGEFLQTHTPGELNVDTGVAFRRAAAQRLLVHPSLSRELSQATDVVFEYSLVEDRLAGASGLESQRAAVHVDHRPSPRVTTTFGYEVTRFDFASTPLTITHVVTARWTGRLTRQTVVALGGGPRLGDGRIMPELSASIHWTTRAVDAALDYARSQVTLIGVPGLVETETLGAPIRWTASRRIDLTISPGVSRLAYRDVADLAYRVRVEAAHAVTANTSWIAAYDASFQQGHIYGAGMPHPVGIARHVIAVGVRRSAARQEPRR